MRTLRAEELNLVAGGVDLDNYRTSDNVTDQTCNLTNYRAYLDAMVSQGEITRHEANILMGERIQLCTPQVR
jgi:hypothetical protein